MTKRIAILWLSLMLILSGLPIFASGNGQTESERDYDNAIEELVSLGIMSGYPDGSFKAEKTITRAEFAKIITLATGNADDVHIYQNSPSIFDDVAMSAWYHPYVRLAVENGYLKGYKDGTFQPGKEITYAEVLTVFIRALGYEDDELSGVWPESHVQQALLIGITDHLDSGMYHQSATRGDVAFFTANSIHLPTISYDEAGEITEGKPLVNKLIDTVQELYLTTYVDPVHLNSIYVTDSISTEALNTIMSGLVRLGRDGSPLPEIAERWDISEDGTVYTFYLRDDAKWSNGEAVTAHDFRFAWLQAIDGTNPAQFSFLLTNYIKNAKEYYQYTAERLLQQENNIEESTTEEVTVDDVGIKILDDKTLQVELIEPTPYFATITAMPVFLPINETFYMESGDDYGKSPEHLLYNGPFVLSKWQQGQKLVYAKNENYWDKKTVKLDKITFDVFKDGNTEISLYESGYVDQVDLMRKEQVIEYMDHSDFFSWSDLSHFYIEFNQRGDNYQGSNAEVGKALANAKVRRAISMAFDRSAVTEEALGMDNDPAYGWVPYELNNFRETGGDLFEDNNGEEAKRLLEEGLKEAGVSSEDFQQLNFVTGDNAIAYETAESLKQSLQRNLGIELNVDHVPFIERLRRSKNGNFDLIFSGWGADYRDPMTFMDLFITDGAFNHGGYSSEKYDRLISLAKKTMDPVKRTEILLEAERILIAEDMAIAPLYFNNNSGLIRPYVKSVYFKGGLNPKREFKWAYIKGK